MRISYIEIEFHAFKIQRVIAIGKKRKKKIGMERGIGGEINGKNSTSFQ